MKEALQTIIGVIFFVAALTVPDLAGVLRVIISGFGAFVAGDGFRQLLNRLR